MASPPLTVYISVGHGTKWSRQDLKGAIEHYKEALKERGHLSTAQDFKEYITSTSKLGAQPVLYNGSFILTNRLSANAEGYGLGTCAEFDDVGKRTLKTESGKSIEYTNFLTEQDFALPLAVELAKDLKKRGFNVILDRAGVSDNIELPYERAQKSNKANADLFIELHCDYPRNGTVAYVRPGSDDTMLSLAKNLARNVHISLKTKDAEGKRRELRTLTYSDAPAFLIELGGLGELKHLLKTPGWEAEVSRRIGNFLADNRTMEYLTKIKNDKSKEWLKTARAIERPELKTKTSARLRH